MSTQRLAAELNDRVEASQRRQTTQEQRAAQGQEIFAGVRAGVDIGAPEAARLRTGFGKVARAYRDFDAIERIVRGAPGLDVRINRQAAAQLRTRLLGPRGLAASMQGSGVINENELPVLNAALPDPSELESMTFGTFQAQMDEWKAKLEEEVMSELFTRNVDEAGVARVISALRAGRWDQARSEAAAATENSAQRSDTVRVSNGRETLRIPRADLAAAQTDGFREVQ